MKRKMLQIFLKVSRRKDLVDKEDEDDKKDKVTQIDWEKDR